MHRHSPLRGRLRRMLAYAPALLLVGCGTLWVRSHNVSEEVALCIPGKIVFALRSNAGTIKFAYLDAPPSFDLPDVQHWEVRWIAARPGSFFGRPTPLQRLGFDLWVSPWESYKSLRVIVPWWLLMTLAALLTAWPLVGALRRRRRQRAALCPACGYDLTGNASGVCPECGSGSPGRCPECGEAAPPAAAASTPSALSR